MSEVLRGYAAIVADALTLSGVMPGDEGYLAAVGRTIAAWPHLSGRHFPEGPLRDAVQELRGY